MKHEPTSPATFTVPGVHLLPNDMCFSSRRGPLTPEGLDRLLYKLRDQAGAEHFKGVSVAAHRWRHTHAVKALEAGTDVYILSRQMGHSDVTTTGSYLKALSARQARQLAPSVLDSLR